MRYIAWLGLSLLVVATLGCTSDKNAGSIDDPVGFGGSPGGGGSNADSATDVWVDSESGCSNDSSADHCDSAADSSEDAVLDVAEDLVSEYNIQPCPVASRAIGTSGFHATSPSPGAFVAAYNAELASMNYPGPMLMVFDGLDSLDSSKWKLQVGPLTGVDGSTKVSFFGSPAEVPFALGEGFAINLPKTPANFVLRFVTPTTVADLPIVGISVSGVFDSMCSALKVEVVGMYLPSTAASLPFHGSTVGALMGSPDQDIDGGTANGWLLTLSGEAQAVELQ